MTSDRIVGVSVPRKEGRDKVTGQAQYVDDMTLPGVLYGATVRSQIPRGKIKKITFGAGIAWDEFVVVSAKDIPGKNVVALIVDDQKIEKKHVNLYEPLWISVPDRPEPVQVVVNSISKDNVKGYLSEPKYRKSELAGTESAKASTRTLNTPAANTAQPDHDSDTGAIPPQ